MFQADIESVRTNWERASVQYHGILFDLDGTLLDTLEDLGNAMNRVLERYGFPQHPLESYRYFVGDGMESLVRRAIPQNRRDQPLLSECVAAMQEEYGRRWMERTHPYTGIPELLTALAARGIKMAIFSNKQDEFTQITVNRFLSRWPFEVVVGARPSVPKKPDPTIPLQISRSMNIPPSALLYAGDTSTDMLTANAAGMYAVGVLWGFREADELLGSGAKVLVEKPVEILHLLAS